MTESQRSARDHGDWVFELAVRELFATLLKARRATVRYPDGDALRDAAIAEFLRCARRLLSHWPLAVRLGPDGVRLGEHLVYADGEEETLCAELAAAGVRELALDCRTAPIELLDLVARRPA